MSRLLEWMLLYDSRMPGVGRYRPHEQLACDGAGVNVWVRALRSYASRTPGADW